VVGGAELLADRPGLRVALLADLEEIGISETWSDPDGPSPPQQHLHHRHVESFYVIAGEMTFTAGGREQRATAGTWVQIQPGTPHTFAPSGTDEVRFLNIHTPSCGYGTFLRGLHEARTDDDLVTVRAAFDQEPA
jgi:mannose-6-phosphate isomerase-like protein (cupin superfamily)